MNDLKFETPDLIYGRLLESVHVSGYSAERACIGLEWLLTEDRWKSVGNGYNSWDAFLESINVSQFKYSINQRKNLAKLMADIGASERVIAKTIGVSESTINRDLRNPSNECTDKNISNKIDSNADILHLEEDITSENDVTPSNECTDKNISILATDGSELLKTAVNVKNIDMKRIEKKEEQTKRFDELKQKEYLPPTGKYDVIVIDPPWPMVKIDRDVSPNQTGFDYPTMNESEITQMEMPSENDCHLFMWTTHKFLPMALRIIEAWGFKYTLTMVWHKNGGFQPFGLPQYNCEFCIYARKGNPQFVDTKSFFTCFNANRRKHSEKPKEFYDLIRRVTVGKRIDIFNRRKIKGFDVWGNESGD